jgi:hypothetical protein
MTEEQELRMKVLQEVRGILPPQYPDFLIIVEQLYQYIKNGTVPPKMDEPGAMPKEDVMVRKLVLD